MNHERALRVTNSFLVLIGYQLHWYNVKDRRYRLSLWAIINFGILSVTYVVCFLHHFEQSQVLNLFKTISPFLRKLINVQLLLGAKVFLYNLYELKEVSRASNGLAELMPRVFARRFRREEAFVYFLLFSTILICCGFLLYIAYEMEFKIPSRDIIMIFTAIFIPHFALAGALKFYNVSLWLLREEIERLIDDFVAISGNARQQNPTEIGFCVDISNKIDIELVQSEKALIRIFNRLQLIVQTKRKLLKALRTQLTILLLLNSFCILQEIHVHINFYTDWYIMFDLRHRRVFYAAIYGAYTFISWDYLCLCLTHVLFNQMKSKFYRKICDSLKEWQDMKKASKKIIKDIRNSLKTEFNFQMFGFHKLTTSKFIWLQVLIAIIVTIIILCNYLNNRIDFLQNQCENDK